jgi:hypothetical protein
VIGDVANVGNVVHVIDVGISMVDVVGDNINIINNSCMTTVNVGGTCNNVSNMD